MRISQLLKSAAVAASATFMLAGGVGVASAHDVVLHSTPADGSTVTSFPREITLEFSAIPKDSFNTVAVSDADSQTVLFTAQPHRNEQFMTVAVPDDVHPGTGHYIVGFQITSSDGHATRGKTTFTVADSTQVTTASGDAVPHQNQPASEAPADDRASGPSLGIIVALMALVLVCAGVAFTIKKRK